MTITYLPGVNPPPVSASPIGWMQALHGAEDVVRARLGLLVALALRMGVEGAGRATHAQLAADTGWSVRTAERTTAWARKNGWLVQLERGRRSWDGQAVASTWQLVYPPTHTPPDGGQPDNGPAAYPPSGDGDLWTNPSGGGWPDDPYPPEAGTRADTGSVNPTPLSALEEDPHLRPPPPPEGPPAATPSPTPDAGPVRAAVATALAGAATAVEVAAIAAEVAAEGRIRMPDRWAASDAGRADLACRLQRHRATPPPPARAPAAAPPERRPPAEGMSPPVEPQLRADEGWDDHDTVKAGLASARAALGRARAPRRPRVAA